MFIDERPTCAPMHQSTNEVSMTKFIKKDPKSPKVDRLTAETPRFDPARTRVKPSHRRPLGAQLECHQQGQCMHFFVTNGDAAVMMALRCCCCCCC
jgi:hypothetical protein